MTVVAQPSHEELWNPVLDLTAGLNEEGEIGHLPCSSNLELSITCAGHSKGEKRCR